MGWLDRIVQAFILTFGITQPTADKKHLANFFIGGLLLLIVLGLMGMIVLGVRQFLA